jgi:hypothetical protein
MGMSRRAITNKLLLLLIMVALVGGIAAVRTALSIRHVWEGVFAIPTPPLSVGRGGGARLIGGGDAAAHHRWSTSSGCASSSTDGWGGGQVCLARRSTPSCNNTPSTP